MDKLLTVFEYYYFEKLCEHDVLKFNVRLKLDKAFSEAYKSYLDTMRNIRDISLIDKLDFLNSLEYPKENNFYQEIKGEIQ